MRRPFIEMTGWKRMETLRGRSSLKDCRFCGIKPVVTENSSGLFTISCARCWWDHPEEAIDVCSPNLYEAIKEWNRMNQKKEGEMNDQNIL